MQKENYGRKIKQNLEMHKGVFKEFALPFAYKHISNEERKNMIFLYQNHYVCLSDAMPEQFIVTSPLQPCVFVGVRNEELGKAVFMHCSVHTDSEKVAQIINEELASTSMSNSITVYIYTNKLVNELHAQLFNVFGVKNSNFDFSYKSKMNEELKAMFDKNQAINWCQVLSLKNCISRICKIPRDSILTALNNSAIKDGELGEYEFAELGVYSTSNAILYNVCVMHENLVPNVDLTKITSLDERIEECQNKIREMNATKIKLPQVVLQNLFSSTLFKQSPTPGAYNIDLN